MDCSAEYTDVDSVDQNLSPLTMTTVSSTSGQSSQSIEIEMDSSTAEASSQMTEEALTNDLHGLTLDETVAQSPKSQGPLFEEKMKLIQQQLVLLLHADKCQRREHFNSKQQCHLPHCATMKNVLNHLSTCQVTRSCPVTHCSSSRQIISHWKHCQKTKCPVCSPLTRASQGTLNLNEPTQTTSVSPTSSSPGAEFVEKMLTDLHLYATEIETTPSTSMGDAVPTVTNVTENSKAWQADVSPELRHHLVCKIVQAIFPSPDPGAFTDPRMRNLVAYAKHVEKDKFEGSGSRSEYYHALADKMYTIQRELEDKRQSRRQQQQQQQQQRQLES